MNAFLKPLKPLSTSPDPFNAEKTRCLKLLRQFLTHNYVLAELIPLAQTRGLPKRLALTFANNLMEDAEVNIVWVSETLHRQALQLLENRQDRTYSLCHAMSFVIMRERGLTEALTTDKHFEQKGFTRLLSG